jgi:ribosomal protein S11
LKGLYKYDTIIFLKFSRKNFRLHICNSEGLIKKTFVSDLIACKKSQRDKFFAIRPVLKDALFFLKSQKDMDKVLVCIKGVGINKWSTLNYLMQSFFLNRRIKSIVDLTSLPFGGCRSRRLPRK